MSWRWPLLTLALLVPALLVPALLSPAPAAAYRRSTVDDIPDGIPLYWATPRVEVRLAAGTVPGVPAEDAVLAFQRSLRTWSLAGGCTSVTLVDGGEVSGLSTNLGRTTPDMENRVVFRDADWPPELGPETLALTSAVYRRTSGQIIDADIDVNAVDHVWSAGAAPVTGHDDVENTLTHELGHALGFAHSDVADATMYASADLEETRKRDLAEDDIIAICDVYPGGSRRGPRSSCSAAASGSRGARGWLALAFLAMIVARGLRSSRRARRAT
ncbi:MAG: matrixin family metalloprotease [Deltaproteobacteria bacterium]|nr:matrixin family metalloprotease [Deltaproteobacteria bacterium]